MIMSMKERINQIKYTLDHRKAFLKVEKQLTGHNTLRGYLHDLDKVFLKLFLSNKTVHNIHRSCSRHHLKAHTHEDYVQMVIDWECARITKPDKPLNARDTLYKYYKNLSDKIEPVLDELGLWGTKYVTDTKSIKSINYDSVSTTVNNDNYIRIGNKVINKGDWVCYI